jgi:hypothetical protein
MVDDLSVQATGPLMSQEMSPTTFILQSFDCNISLVIISGAPLPWKCPVITISDTFVNRSKLLI